MKIHTSLRDHTGAGYRGGNRRLCVVRSLVAAVASVALVLAPVQLAQGAERTQLKPGWNMFSPEQDIQLGRQASQQAEKQLRMLNDPRVDRYLNELGKKLAAHAPGYKYPYQYKCVNDMSINAFALPGGFIFINRGAIEAARDEAQLAGVMAHETAHVALRHGTNQATKAYAWQLPLGILGAAVGGNSVGALLVQLGAGFTLNSILLKYSRTDETQADVLGTQILYDSGYDPRAMAQFFETIQAESKGREPIQFFSDHPNPGNRMERVDEEIDKLGGPPKSYKTDSSAFRSVHRYLEKLPPPPKKSAAGSGGSAGVVTPPPAPSKQTVFYRTDELSLRYPANWKASGQGSAFSLFPEGGVVRDNEGHESLAYGVIVNMFGPQKSVDSAPTLDEATAQLIEGLRQSNPNMRIERQHESTRVDDRPALDTYLSNDSPLGGRETDWLVTTLRPDGLLYIVCVVPEGEYAAYEHAFRNIVYSIHLKN